MTDSAGGPVSVALGKRIRAVKKKINKAEQIEQSVAAGKEINEDQIETMKSKPGCVAVIDELTKLDALLKEAVAEEVKAARAEWEVARAAEKEAEEANIAAKTQAEAAAKAEETAQSAATAAEACGKAVHQAISQIIPLIYFSRMFERSSKELLSHNPHERDACIHQLTQNEHVRVSERYACRSWVNQATGEELKETDIDLIVQFGKLLTCRPAGQIISHEMAIQQCCKLAEKILGSSYEPLEGVQAVPGQAPPTGSYLVHQVAKIKSSEYFTVKPVSQDPQPTANVAEPPAPQAGAAAPSGSPAAKGEAPKKADDKPKEASAGGGSPQAPPAGAAGADPAAAAVGNAPPQPPSGPAGNLHPPPPASGAAGVPPHMHPPPEHWPFGAMGMPGANSGVPPGLGPMDPQQHMPSMPGGPQVPVTHGAAADPMLSHGQHLPFQQPGMHMSFPGHSFMMPQHAGGMHHMLPPGAFDPMYHGMYMGPPGTKMDGAPPGAPMHMGDASKAGLMMKDGGMPNAPAANGHAEGSNAHQGGGNRSNPRAQGGGQGGGRGNRNRNPRADGGRGGGARGDSGNAGGGRNRNFEGRGRGRGGQGKQQQQQQNGTQANNPQQQEQPAPPPAAQNLPPVV